MRRVLTFVLGVIIGQWLVFGAVASPADYHIRAQRAMKAQDYLEAMQLWSRAAALQPGEPVFHYYRGLALSRLGLKLSAIESFQIALLLQPAPQLARQVLQEISRMQQAGALTVQETTVPLEHGLGVWIARVVLNDSRTGRFLVDTGSSVTVISPTLAAEIGIAGGPDGTPVELQTLGGRTAGAPAIVGSLRVGTLELKDAPVVLHDPGLGLDGILGNTFLSRYQITVDADRRQLHLRPLVREEPSALVRE
jgi:clan AA aspartic protease (TIGR02281 family)